MSKWRFREKQIRIIGQNQKTVRQMRNCGRTRHKNKRRDIEKWDQTGSPEIPDRGETSERKPGLPSGEATMRAEC